MDATTPSVLEETLQISKRKGVKDAVKENHGNKPALSTPDQTVKYFGGLLEFRTKLVWTNIIFFFVLHSVGLYGLGTVFANIFKWSHIVTFIYVFSLGQLTAIGISGGAHRMFSHRSFKTTVPLKILLLTLFLLAGENSMYEWVRDHRQHHKYVDTDADPHNAKRGFFFSHIGWLLMKKHPDVYEKKKTIDMSDMEADPHVMFQKKYIKELFFGLNIPLTILPYFVFGCPLWDTICIGVFRIILVWNFTWSVNSFAHLYGDKPYDKNIMSTDNRGVSIITSGDGWHNFHHTFPWDYRSAELGSDCNKTAAFIDFCARRGWAYDLKTVSPELVMKTAARSGDGSRKKNHEKLRE